MTHLATRFWDPFNIERWFHNTTYRFTNSGKAQIENYKIYKLNNGKFLVRLEYDDDTKFIHEDLTVRETLADAKEYVGSQVSYFKQKTARPELVWDGTNDALDGETSA